MTDFRADVKKAVEFGIARFAPIWQLDWNNIMAESRGITDRELMQQALDAMLNFPNDISDEMFESIRVLRARLAQPEQEPVAWITDGGKGELWWHQSVKFDDDGNLIGENPDDIPLYTAPPQREWQGLTENEIKHLWYEACQTNLELTSQLIVHLARNIEAKLKEKNA